MGIFNPDSEFMMFISKVADYIIINLFCLVLSIPVVTAGAAMTAKFYVAMKMERGEEPQVVKAFFKSFKENFKQSTLIWLPALAISLIIVWDWYSILFGKTQSLFFGGKIIFLILTVLWWAFVYNIFPMIARFDISSKELLKGAMTFTFLNFPRMFLILLLTALSYVIEAWYMSWALAIWVLCTTVILYYATKMYVSEYRKIEERM